MYIFYYVYYTTFPPPPFPPPLPSPPHHTPHLLIAVAPVFNGFTAGWPACAGDLSAVNLPYHPHPTLLCFLQPVDRSNYFIQLTAPQTATDRQYDQRTVTVTQTDSATELYNIDAILPEYALRERQTVQHFVCHFLCCMIQNSYLC